MCNAPVGGRVAAPKGEGGGPLQRGVGYQGYCQHAAATASHSQGSAARHAQCDDGVSSSSSTLIGCAFCHPHSHKVAGDARYTAPYHSNFTAPKAAPSPLHELVWPPTHTPPSLLGVCRRGGESPPLPPRASAVPPPACRCCSGRCS